MKYLDENGLIRFWQKTKEYVDMNSGGGGGGSLPYLQKDYTSYEITTRNGQYYETYSSPLFEPDTTKVISKNNVKVGEFNVIEMSVVEIPILTNIVNQMVAAMGISVNISRATYITNVSNWTDLFMGGASGFIFVTFTDTTLGNVISYYDTTPVTQSDKISIIETLNIPLNTSYFEPVLLWEGECSEHTDFIFTDNPAKFSSLVIVFIENTSYDKNEKISYSIIMNNMVSFHLNIESFLSGYISPIEKKLKTMSTREIAAVKITKIYGIYY